MSPGRRARFSARRSTQKETLHEDDHPRRRGARGGTRRRLGADEPDRQHTRHRNTGGTANPTPSAQTPDNRAPARTRAATVPALRPDPPIRRQPGGNAPSGVNASGQATIVPLSALERGANSFTEGQARTRLEGAGLTNVTALQKDDQGIWRGKAMRSGQSVTVGFDYKGNIGVQ